MPKRKPVKYLSDKEIEEILFRESSDEDVDDVEAEEMYDSDSDIDYIPKPGEDDESDSDGFEPCTSSRQRKKKQRQDSGRPTTTEIAIPGPASVSTAHPTSPATPDAAPAAPDAASVPPDAAPATPDVAPATPDAVSARSHAGHRGRRHHHGGDAVAYIVRLENNTSRVLPVSSGILGLRQWLLLGQLHETSCLLLHQAQHQRHQMLTLLRSASHYFLRTKSLTKL